MRTHGAEPLSARPRSRRGPVLAGLLLAAPLILLAVWLVAGGLSRSFGPTPPGAAPARDAGAASLTSIAGFPAPEGDFPADRLHERVNGAAEALQAAGCDRLLFWRFEDPPVEVELLVFRRTEGASRVLERDAGPDLAPGPGEEASVADRSILFRRGRFYARLIGDPGEDFDPARLLDLARKLDSFLLASDAGDSP